MEYFSGGNNCRDSWIIIAVIIFILIIVVLRWKTVYGTACGTTGGRTILERQSTDSQTNNPGLDPFYIPQDYSTWNMDVHEGLHRLYSTADVDPLITGQLYEYANYIKPMYAERVSHVDSQGLTEFNSSGGSGDPGVDVGPLTAFDDGIPEEWQMPSTPVQWYRLHQRDYYGREGPTVYDEKLYSLTEPDHDPLM